MKIYAHLFLFSFSYIIQLLLFILSVYYSVIMISGWLPLPNRKRKSDDVVYYNKFAIVVPAHNEEKVIRSMVGSLQKQQYDKELFQIFVVCDNCTDNTEYETSKTQARILVRNNDEEKARMHWNGLLQEFSL